MGPLSVFRTEQLVLWQSRNLGFAFPYLNPGFHSHFDSWYPISDWNFLFRSKTVTPISATLSGHISACVSTLHLQHKLFNFLSKTSRVQIQLLMLHVIRILIFWQWWAFCSCICYRESIRRPILPFFWDKLSAFFIYVHGNLHSYFFPWDKKTIKCKKGPLFEFIANAGNEASMWW